jgi:hypothetical protein
VINYSRLSLTRCIHFVARILICALLKLNFDHAANAPYNVAVVCPVFGLLLLHHDGVAVARKFTTARWASDRAKTAAGSDTALDAGAGQDVMKFSTP